MKNEWASNTGREGLSRLLQFTVTEKWHLEVELCQKAFTRLRRSDLVNSSEVKQATWETHGFYYWPKDPIQRWWDEKHWFKTTREQRHGEAVLGVRMYNPGDWLEQKLRNRVRSWCQRKPSSRAPGLTRWTEPPLQQQSQALLPNTALCGLCSHGLCGRPSQMKTNFCLCALFPFRWIVWIFGSASEEGLMRTWWTC